MINKIVATDQAPPSNCMAISEIKVAMTLILLILFTSFPLSTKGASQSIPLTVISAYENSDSSCPPEEILKVARESILTMVQRMTSGT